MVKAVSGAAVDRADAGAVAVVIVTVAKSDAALGTAG